jgi:hypothetical protein
MIHECVSYNSAPPLNQSKLSAVGGRRYKASRSCPSLPPDIDDVTSLILYLKQAVFCIHRSVTLKKKYFNHFIGSNMNSKEIPIKKLKTEAIRPVCSVISTDN